MKKTAKLSPCGYYRYNLTRTWDDKLPKLVWCMLNPSKADHQINDPTISTCIGFAKGIGNGFGGIIVVNLFPFRATNPNELLEQDIPDRVMKKNLEEIALAVDPDRCTIAAWGCHRVVRDFNSYVCEVTELIASLTDHFYCLCKTKEGYPRHPLRVGYKTQPIPYP